MPLGDPPISSDLKGSLALSDQSLSKAERAGPERCPDLGVGGESEVA